MLDHKIVNNEAFLKVRDPRKIDFTDMPVPLAVANLLSSEEK